MYESQRTDGFKGGLQKGQIAGDALAIKQDKLCKNLRNDLSKIFTNLIQN